MNLNTLNTFRHRVYESFEQAADALFNTVDALASEPAAQSFPELSLSPFFVRRWPSLYEAFEDGKIDTDRLREVFVQFAPASVRRPPRLSGGRYQFPVSPRGPDLGRSHAASDPEHAGSLACGESRLGHQQCGAVAGGSRPGNLCAGQSARDFLATGHRGGSQPGAGGGRSVGGARAATSDHRGSLVCLCSVSGSHDRCASQLPVARQSQSRLLSSCPCSPARSARGESQRWGPLSM